MVSNPKRGELLLNYDNNELFFVRKSNGEIVSIARSIYDKIMSTRIKNNKVEVFSADTLDPRPGKYDIVPPLNERIYNAFYFIVTGRRTYIPAERQPLTAQTWAVKQGKKFLGKNSGYSEEEEE
jgi:hypothetical protein